MHDTSGSIFFVYLFKSVLEFRGESQPETNGYLCFKYLNQMGMRTLEQIKNSGSNTKGQRGDRQIPVS